MNPDAMKRWLVISLVINLFLVCGIAGGTWRWWNTAGAVQGRALRFAAEGLSAEQRRNYRATLKEARREVGAAIQEARDDRREVLRLLDAPQLDRAAVMTALSRARDADMVARAKVEASVVDFAASLSLEDRQKLVDGLTRRSSLGPPPAAAAK
jgi:uncharacterized membrane protein